MWALHEKKHIDVDYSIQSRCEGLLQGYETKFSRQNRRGTHTELYGKGAIWMMGKGEVWGLLPKKFFEYHAPESRKSHGSTSVSRRNAF